MKIVKLYDIERPFFHREDGKFTMSGAVDYDDYGFVNSRAPKNFTYTINKTETNYDIAMGVDRALFHHFYAMQTAKKERNIFTVAWLMTPREIYDNIYPYARGMISELDVFITSDQEFIDEHENAFYVPPIDNWHYNKTFEGHRTPEDWIYENILKEQMR
jgi:hypothetical protein